MPRPKSQNPRNVLTSINLSAVEMQHIKQVQKEHGVPLRTLLLLGANVLTLSQSSGKRSDVDVEVTLNPNLTKRYQ